MKKLLSVLATIGIAVSSVTSVVACNTKKENNPEDKKNISEIVQDFEQDVSKIWVEHYEKEIAGNLIGLESMEEGNEFLNKENIQKFSKQKSKLTFENKKQLTNDIEKFFKVKLLKKNLNNLKNISKYKVILDDIDSVFENIELVFDDDFQITSGEIEGSYIGNVVVDYKIVTQYAGVNDVERFKQSGTLKYTSTESQSFKKVGDAMYKNIAKDMFISKETEKYVNLKWSDIKGESDDFDAYLSSDNQLKKYYNESSEFHESLLKTINNKYFKQHFSSLNIRYDKKNIYKTDSFTEQNKDYLIVNNLYKSNEVFASFDMSELEEYKQVSQILQGNENSINNFLQKNFSVLKWSEIQENFKIAKNKFLDDILLNISEKDAYKNTNSYKLAIAMGYVEFLGPSIKIRNGDSSYNHQLPDFKLAISYSINGESNENYESLIDFSLKLFDIYKQIYKVEPIKEENHNYYFNFGFNSKKIWKFDSGSEEIELSNKNDFNNALSKFTFEYDQNIKSNLNNIKVSPKALVNNKIFFSMSFLNDSFSKPAFATNKIKSGYLKILNFASGDQNLNIFENYNDIILNLFGIIKIKIDLKDKSYKSDKNLVLF